MREKEREVYEKGLPKTIGEYSPEDRRKRMMEYFDDEKQYRDYEKRTTDKDGKPVLQKWEYTGTSIGFIPPSDNTKEDQNYVDIINASKIKPQHGLTKISLYLHQYYAADFPGTGKHNVLFHFGSTNAITSGDPQQIAFNQIFELSENSVASTQGYRIFKNLNVDTDGLDLIFEIVNVNNKEDQPLKNLLASTVFQSGIDVLNSYNPVVSPFTKCMVGLLDLYACRNDNLPIQKGIIGFNLNSLQTACKLSQGSYVFVQDQTGQLNWANYQYNKDKRAIEEKTNPSKRLDLNHMIIGVY